MANDKKAQSFDKLFFDKFKVGKKFKKNQIIITPEVNPQGIYYIKSGYVRQYLISNDGKELTFNIYKPGTYFSMIWALTETPNIYFFECLTKTEVILIPKENIIEQLTQNPSALLDLTKRTLSGLDGLTRLMDALLSKNAYKQTCSILLVLSKRFGVRKDNQIIINIPLTHRIIGTLAGLSREATSRELEKLTKENIIMQKTHKIIIKNLTKLENESVINFADVTP